MTQAFTSLVGSLSRLGIRPFAPTEERKWSIGGARPNPEVGAVAPSTSPLDRLTAALRRYRIRQQWQRDLRDLDDRQLDDIGISRADAERTIERIRFWI